MQDFWSALEQAKTRIDTLAARVSTMENRMNTIEKLLLRAKSDRAFMISLLGAQLILSVSSFAKLFFG